jgi:hypothetical protein
MMPYTSFRLETGHHANVFLTGKHNNYIVPGGIPSLADVAQCHRTLKETDRDYMGI